MWDWGQGIMTVLEEHRKKELEKKARSRRQMKSLSYVNICHGIVIAFDRNLMHAWGSFL